MRANKYHHQYINAINTIDGVNELLLSGFLGNTDPELCKEAFAEAKKIVDVNKCCRDFRERFCCDDVHIELMDEYKCWGQFTKSGRDKANKNGEEIPSFVELCDAVKLYIKKRLPYSK